MLSGRGVFVSAPVGGLWKCSVVPRDAEPRRCFPSTAPFRSEQSAASPFTLTFSFVYICKKGDEEALTFFFAFPTAVFTVWSNRHSDFSASPEERWVWFYRWGKAGKVSCACDGLKRPGLALAQNFTLPDLSVNTRPCLFSFTVYTQTHDRQTNR